MRDLNAEATGIADQPVAAAFALLRDLERYPSWYPAVARSVAVLARDAEGAPATVDVVLALAAGPLRRDFRMRMAVRAQRSSLVALERIADDRGDHERFTIDWRLESLDAARTRLTLAMGARLELPPFLPVGKISHDVAQGFVTAALTRLA